jgi:acetyltransferase-like isoleucine patch superfamily enzyme
MTNYIKKTAKIAKLTSIETSIKGSSLYVDEDSVIDDFVKIKFVGGEGDIKIGKKVYLNSFTVLYSGNGITIGDHVQIGPNCSLTPVNHAYKDKSKLIMEQRFSTSKGGIIIEDDVWISAGVTILDGSHIKKGAVIGANSLVNGVIEEYSINFGVPCKCVGYRE